MPVVTASVGELVRGRRLSLGLTQQQLCEMTGLSQNYLSQVETGAIRVPGIPILRRLAAALDLSDEEMTRAAGLVVEIVEGGSGAWIPLRGRVPADSIRWVELEQRGQSVEIPRSWVDRARSPLFAVQISGDCLLGRRIGDGDVVVCERYEGERQIRNETIVLIRMGNEYTCKVWRRAGLSTELRDGDDNVVAVLAPGDDYEVLGTYFGHFGGAFVNIRG